MAVILRSPLLARLEDDTLAYAHAIVTNSTPPAGDTVAQSSARQAMAALLASLTVLRASLALRPVSGQHINSHVETLAQATVDILAERPGAEDRLLPLLERLL